ncbi:MAG: 4Fe-4S dicluster domain-containing protein [Thermodesulfobacteriota bacterium]
MPRTADIQTENGNANATVAEVLKQIMATDAVDAMLVPYRQAGNRMIMPTLITDAELLSHAEPLAPAFAVSAARLVSRLTRRPSGRRLAAVLRPCEIRAFIELVKLNQGQIEDIVIIGIDCPGAFQNTDFFEAMDTHGEKITDWFLQSALPQNGEVTDAPGLATACRTCTQPTPAGGDIAVGLFGMDIGQNFQLYSQTEKGDAVFDQMDLTAAEVSPQRQAAVESLVSRRSEARQQMIDETRAATDSLEKMAEYFSRCINCYNCRVACPVCYCRECVFTTDVFDHAPEQYMKWGQRKGSVKMPTDTLFYHLTRLAHMSTACVNCGQCSNACPNDIPVMELFAAVSEQTQAAFDYVPGRSAEESPPLAVFKEAEFEEVVGVK